jgi:RimJ/RimL family protein N-acetyltransferase
MELMTRHVQACYAHDDAGNIVRINDWIGNAAPRFWLGRTPEGSIWRFRRDVPPSVRAEIEASCREEPRCTGEPRPPLHDSTYRRLLGEDDAGLDVVAGPTYWFRRAVRAHGDVARITEENRDLLRDGLEAWLPDVPHQQPMVVSLHAGRAVSICASVRITLQAHEAGVETVPAFRRRGHALAAVAAWAAAVMALGRVALYSTSWDNRASQAVAARLGLEAFGQEYRIG